MELITAEGAENGLEFTIVRPFNWIGPRMDFIPGVDGPSEGVPRVLACFSNVSSNSYLVSDSLSSFVWKEIEEKQKFTNLLFFVSLRTSYVESHLSLLMEVNPREPLFTLRMPLKL